MLGRLDSASVGASLWASEITTFGERLGNILVRLEEELLGVSDNARLGDLLGDTLNNSSGDLVGCSFGEGAASCSSVGS
jgi:hypothetical protein